MTVTIMEYLPNGYVLEGADGVFPLSTDSMVLSHFVHLPKNARVLDLGAGCGILGVLLCASNATCVVTGVELSERAHAAAQANIARNGLAGRFHSICADLRNVPLPAGSFDVCLSNPPYFTGGPASKEMPLARREDCCSPAELFAAAAKALKFGGDFFLVHKPERLAELITCGSRVQLEAKRLLLVRHRLHSDISLILLQFRKGAKPGLKIEEAALFDTENNPTEFYRAVYHIT